MKAMSAEIDSLEVTVPELTDIPIIVLTIVPGLNRSFL